VIGFFAKHLVSQGVLFENNLKLMEDCSMDGQVIKQMRESDIKNLKHGDRIKYTNHISSSFDIESDAVFMCIHEETGQLIIETIDGLKYMPRNLFSKKVIK